MKTMITGIERISFTPHGDERGKLIAIEGNQDVAFPIERIYFIYDVLLFKPHFYIIQIVMITQKSRKAIPVMAFSFGGNRL